MTNKENLLGQQEQRRKKQPHIIKKFDEYKEQVKNGTFYFTINWETDISKIDLNKLRDVPNIEISNCEIIELNLDKVIDNLFPGNVNNIFLKNEINLKKINDYKFVELIELIENNINIFPPIIQLEEMKMSCYNNIIILNGNHRIAISRILKKVKIPFLTEKKYLKSLNDLEKY